MLLQDAENISAIALYPWPLYPVSFVMAVVLTLNFLGDGRLAAADPCEA